MGRAIKHCLECGASFARKKGYSAAQWANAKFCSRACFGAAATKRLAAERPSLRERFDALFDKTEGCWEWQGTIDGYGYGVIDHLYHRYRAHVLALEFDGRPVAVGGIACHHCDNPRCVNPAHLYPGTEKTNAEDASQRFRLRHGERHHQAKLTEADVRTMRALDLPYAEIGRRFGVSRPTAKRAITGETWRHVE